MNNIISNNAQLRKHIRDKSNAGRDAFKHLVSSPFS